MEEVPEPDLVGDFQKRIAVRRITCSPNGATSIVPCEVTYSPTNLPIELTILELVIDFVHLTRY
jgi:hypothetical protein